MDLLKLLRSKNRCLREFLSLSAGFAASHPEPGSEEFVVALAKLQVEREKALKAFQLFDGRITSAVEALSEAERTPKLIEEVARLHKDGAAILTEIVKSDDGITVAIEAAKLSRKKELNTSQKSKELVSKFKSTWVNEAGTEIDQKL